MPGCQSWCLRRYPWHSGCHSRYMYFGQSGFGIGDYFSSESSFLSGLNPLYFSRIGLLYHQRRMNSKGDKGRIQYYLPMPPEGKKTQSVAVLPIETLGGAGGIRTPYLLTASQTFSRVNYGPEVRILIYQKLSHKASRY